MNEPQKAEFEFHDSSSTPMSSESFHVPFIGHLPGYLEEISKTGSARPDENVYNNHLMSQWERLLNSEASKSESLVQKFLEQHPSLLPGSNSVDGNSGHLAFPTALITQPKLPGMSDRQPDFMWIAKDSLSVYPILIEIETPHKKWFYGEKAEIHSDLSHAQGQLAEWRAWFNRGHNRSAFFDYYELPSYMGRMAIKPRFVLIHGRRCDYTKDRRRIEKAAELAREDERLMSFDRLAPGKNSTLYGTVRRSQNEYEVVAVPPSFSVINNQRHYISAQGWEDVIRATGDMPAERQQFLTATIEEMLQDPHFGSYQWGGRWIHRPQWL
ncbi:Shedu anti-phage system protein SduA domain-containing protein [Streptomyces sp. NPDC059690]|uniref:Shedu anti-phage system protein SduA domain-containing protein n=1 Tax=Streptomyces sp. NPDC059690 TaxID=3346907 RepID=UPI0036BF9A9F